MNELFTLPATAPDRLSAARKRYEAAQHEYDVSPARCDAKGRTTNPGVECALRFEVEQAKAELAAAERERMTRA